MNRGSVCLLAAGWALGGVLADSGEARATPLARSTIAVVPFTGKDKPIGDVSYAALLKAVGTIHATRQFNLLHPKQVIRVVEHHESRVEGLDRKARVDAMGVVLGADWILSGTLERTKAKATFELTLDAVGKPKTSSSKVSGATFVEALSKMPEAILELLSKHGSSKVSFKIDPKKISPVTENHDALVHYATCYRRAIAQPIGIRQPVLLDNPELDGTIDQCKRALQADPKLVEVKAVLGFLYALAGNRRLAEGNLRAVKNHEALLPFYWIGKFWVVSRFHDTDLALTVLDDAIAKYPGFLLARGYLGDSLSALRKYDRALDVFTNYLEAVPRQPWVMGRIGYVHAKAGRHEQSIQWTSKALSIAPSDPELLLEMASRYVDASKYAEAIVILQRVISEGGARGEVHLRLGYAYLMTGKLAPAEREFHRAIEKATRVSEWRTRGRARYDLAKLWMQTGIVDNALRQLGMAIREGFRDRAVFERDPDFKPLLADARFKKLMRSKLKPQNVSTYSSPFRLASESAAIDLEAGRKKKKPGKKETVLLRF